MSSLSDYYFNEQPQIICGLEVPSIINDFNADLPSMVDRFFTKFYYRKADTVDEDHMILVHSNRICLISLAPSHIALRKGVKQVNYNFGNTDRSKNQCSGKGKKGAMNLQPHSALAIVTCNDDTEYRVLSCITAKLIEVNGKLIDQPELLSMEGDGYVAVALPKMENADAKRLGLMTSEEYSALSCENRNTKSSE